MKKYLLLIGLFAILTFNSAHAQGYYYEDDSDYVEQPRRVRRINYQQPEYKEVEYVREQAPHYRKISSKNVVYKPQSEYRQATYYTRPKVNKVRPYIGLDVSTQKMKFGNDENMTYKDGYYNENNELILTEEDTFKDKNKAWSFVMGAKLGQYISGELFYQQSGEQDKKFSDIGPDYEDFVKSTWSYKAYGVDIIGHLPVVQEFELLAALGLGQYEFEGKICETWHDNYHGYGSETLKKDADSLGIRLGIGAQYYITENIALRGMLRYIKMTEDDYVKHLTEFSLGMRYMF